ncbi:hypothetical protein T492DRAFT_191363 [Pavlovales sp. CCMP2436]|nr:hypothetical protein T492DRAFT_191363 [Pavlovales sp. CCMP2436]
MAVRSTLKRWRHCCSGGKWPPSFHSRRPRRISHRSSSGSSSRRSSRRSSSGSSSRRSSSGWDGPVGPRCTVALPRPWPIRQSGVHSWTAPGEPRDACAPVDRGYGIYSIGRALGAQADGRRRGGGGAGVTRRHPRSSQRRGWRGRARGLPRERRIRGPARGPGNSSARLFPDSFGLFPNSLGLFPNSPGGCGDSACRGRGCAWQSRREC